MSILNLNIRRLEGASKLLEDLFYVRLVCTLLLGLPLVHTQSTLKLKEYPSSVGIASTWPHTVCIRSLSSARVDASNFALKFPVRFGARCDDLQELLLSYGIVSTPTLKLMLGGIDFGMAQGSAFGLHCAY
ncbi:hypothetical protein C8R45DRAFT_1093727 [Mycena sanguinolenta]|nr:hypothetical protein C8R45DRAFT_1093727 [Mycena sanguinolenta]